MNSVTSQPLAVIDYRTMPINDRNIGMFPT
jgi:hypothetical protein